MEFQASANGVMALPMDIPLLYSNGNENAGEITYLFNLEQPDGSAQLVQLSEEQAKAFGIASNTISHDSSIYSESLLSKIFVEETTNNHVVQPITNNLNEANNKNRKYLDVSMENNTNSSVGETNLFYSVDIQPDRIPQIQITQDASQALTLFSSSEIPENQPNITYEVAKKAVPVSAKTSITAKVFDKSIMRRKKVKKSCNLPKKNLQFPQQEEINGISFGTVVDEPNSAQVILTVDAARALGLMSNNETEGIQNAVNPFQAIKLSSEVSKFTNKKNLKRKVYSKINDAAVNINKEEFVRIILDGETDNNEVAEYTENSIPLMDVDDVMLRMKLENTPDLININKNEVNNSLIIPNNVKLGKGNATKQKIKKGTKKKINIEKIDSTDQYPNVSPFLPSIVIPRQETNVISKKMVNSIKAKKGKKMSSGKKKTDLNKGQKTCLKEDEKSALATAETPTEIIKNGEMLHSAQNLNQNYEVLNFDSPQLEGVEEQGGSEQTKNIIYRVVFPEELDLNSIPDPPKLQKKGRPRRRSCSEEPEVEETPKPVKKARTRSGRVTRPPEQLRKDFEKIETSEKDTMESEIKTVEFTPLASTESLVNDLQEPEVNQLENHQRKRLIASQYRCPTCKKAYLGHSKMLKHLQMHPDHGPIPERCKNIDNEAWNFLIDISNKNSVGQKGLKFYREIVNFLHNIRILAKIFFKRPTGVDKKTYFVDHSLSSMLGIESGDYILNENELHKDVSMFSFLKNTYCETEDLTPRVNNNNHEKVINENFNLGEFVEKRQPTKPETTENTNFTPNNQNGLHQYDEQLNGTESSKLIVPDIKFHENQFNTVKHTSLPNTFDITSVRSFTEDVFEKRECVDNELNSEGKSINPVLSLHSELLADNSLLNSLPNLRTSVEDLMLNNVHSTQVGNLLDNSTSSDEVMNVDQFVNERFKNFTEPELDLPNTSLNLDLPPLDLFQFHTS